MRDNYWDQFMASGRIEDYLNYRMADCSGYSARETVSGRTENGAESGSRLDACGKEQCESGCTYGHGTLHHANRRI